MKDKLINMLGGFTPTQMEKVVEAVTMHAQSNAPVVVTGFMNNNQSNTNQINN